MNNFTEFIVEYDDRTDQYVDEIKKRRLKTGCQWEH